MNIRKDELRTCNVVHALFWKAKNNIKVAVGCSRDSFTGSASAHYSQKHTVNSPELLQTGTSF